MLGHRKALQILYVKLKTSFLKINSCERPFCVKAKAISGGGAGETQVPWIRDYRDSGTPA